jgi:phage gp16-like protein
MTTAPDQRNRDLATIHIAVKQLGLDDGTYRDMLWTVARVRSAKDLDFTGRMRVLEHLRSKGFRARMGKRAAAGRAPADSAHAKKIRALWLALRDRGALRDASEAALAKWVKRQSGVDSLHWLTPADGARVIEALKLWLARLPIGSDQ